MGTTPSKLAFTAKLHSRQEVAEGTMAFRFEKPAGWTFKPGQFVDLTLLDPPETDGEGNTRSLSIASAPEEETIMVATRMRDSAFKRVLERLPAGTEVKIEGAFGSLTLHKNSERAAVLLAGGIGITPFRSIAVHAARAKLPHRIFLFFGNHRPEDAPFLDELAGLEQQNPNFRLIATMDAMDRSHHPWQGETGFIDQAMLERHLKQAASPLYYIAGPPEMVATMQNLLAQAGVDDEDIRAEEFSGY
jgi:ferredoxin-NADP reductase